MRILGIALVVAGIIVVVVWGGSVRNWGRDGVPVWRYLLFTALGLALTVLGGYLASR